MKLEWNTFLIVENIDSVRLKTPCRYMVILFITYTYKSKIAFTSVGKLIHYTGKQTNTVWSHWMCLRDPIASCNLRTEIMPYFSDPYFIWYPLISSCSSSRTMVLYRQRTMSTWFTRDGRSYRIDIVETQTVATQLTPRISLV